MDASSLATGVALEIDGDIVEDACWLRPDGDSQHVNLTELDAMLKSSIPMESNIAAPANRFSICAPVDL